MERITFNYDDITNFCSQTTQKTPEELKAEFSDLRSYLYDTLYPEIFKKLQDVFGDEEIKYSDFEDFTKNFSSTFDSRFANELLINRLFKAQLLKSTIFNDNPEVLKKLSNDEEFFKLVTLKLNAEKAIERFYGKFAERSDSDSFEMKGYYLTMLKKFNEREGTDIKYYSNSDLNYELDKLMLPNPELKGKTIRNYIITRNESNNYHITPLYVETSYDELGNLSKQKVLFMDSVPTVHMAKLPIEIREGREIKSLAFNRQASSVGCFEDSLLLLKDFQKTQQFSGSDLGYDSFKDTTEAIDSSGKKYLKSNDFPSFLFLHMELWNNLRVFREKKLGQAVKKLGDLSPVLATSKSAPIFEPLAMERVIFPKTSLTTDDIPHDSFMLTSGELFVPASTLFSDSLKSRVYVRGTEGPTGIPESVDTCTLGEEVVVREVSYVNFLEQRKKLSSELGVRCLEKKSGIAIQ